MRRNIFNNIMLVSMLALCGCSNETDIAIKPVKDKTPIALSVGLERANTRAVVTDGDGKTLVALPEGTKIWMAMKSEKASESLYCSTIGTTGAAEKESSSSEVADINKIAFGADYTRFWDDAFGKDASLSVWALTVPGASTVPAGTPSAGVWGEEAVETSVAWSISQAQTAATVAAEDLCFSNNIVGDDKMAYNSGAQAFDQGKLIFYHALSKVTIKMVEGTGFDTESTADFNFDNTTSAQASAGAVPITLKGFGLASSAKFDIADGEFGSYTSADITSMYNKEKTASGYTLEALVMPGKTLDASSTDDAVVFSLDKNAYKVSAKVLAAALNGKDGAKMDGSNIILEAGKNYIFTFKISKTDIKVTATVAQWIDVEAEEFEPKINIYKVYGHEATEDECDDFGKNFALYMSQSINGDYALGTDIQYNDGSYQMDTQLYWPNHETHYFFRGVYPSTATVANNSYITVANGKYDGTKFPSNLMIGYPRKTDGTSDEDCKVHTSKQGICATEGDIRINFQYVMSQVEVKLSTSTGDDKVVLDDNTTIEIVGGYKSGTIKLADGSAVCTDLEKDTYTMQGGTYDDRHDIIIPQSLADLKFRITVKDADNKLDVYEASIKDIEVTPAGGTKGKVNIWQAGKKYIYSLYITKTGIKITATLKDWETVTSGNNHIWM